ncbi:MAG: shikimate dehydrogenase [Longimicrobiales bacterium]
MTSVRASTRVLALLGDPVEHSLSPIIQNAAIAAAGLDGVYVALRCEADDLVSLLRGIAHAGGGGNVTLPHKAAAARILDDRTTAVQLTGACNTFWLENRRLAGDNTDVAGFTAAAETLLGGLEGTRVLLLGAGGAARAVLGALLEQGAEHVVVHNRTRSRAEWMVAELGQAVGGRSVVEVATSPKALTEPGFDLAVNATSLGLNDNDPLPLDPAGTRIGAVLDLVYRPGGTRWVQVAREAGLRAADGTEMLIRQAAAAFERWWTRPAPVAAMRRSLGL